MIIKDIKELCFSEYIGNGRVLCIDYGDKRIGVAVSDIGWNIASPLVILDGNGVFQKLSKLIDQYVVKTIAVGAPQSLSGGESGKQHEKVKRFTIKLEELFQEINIIYWDERLSSVAARRVLVEAEMSHAKKKKNMDKVAASFILQGFLDYVEFSKK